MLRFESAQGQSASLHRRRLLICAAAAALSACGRSATMTVSTTPPLDMQQLNAAGANLAKQARPGVLGAALRNLESGELWALNGAQRFPLQRVAHMVLAAAVLSEVDVGRLRLDEPFTLTDEMLSPPPSPIATAWPGRTRYTASDLLAAAVSGADNTAADVLMKRIGGPGAVSAWLTANDFHEIRVDRYQRELQTETLGMASFRAAWRGEAAFARVAATIPPALRLTARDAYLADPRDTATPRAMAEFLQRLRAGDLISAASAGLLLRLMAQTPLAPARFKAALPDGAGLAHKAGEARFDQGVSPVVNDAGIVTLADGRAYAIAAFLSGARLDGAACDRLIADLGRAMLRGLG